MLVVLGCTTWLLFGSVLDHAIVVVAGVVVCIGAYNIFFEMTPALSIMMLSLAILAAVDNSSLSWLMAMACCKALANACSQACQLYTFNNKQQEGSYHSGKKHMNAKQIVDGHFHLTTSTDT